MFPFLASVQWTFGISSVALVPPGSVTLLLERALALSLSASSATAAKARIDSIIATRLAQNATDVVIACDEVSVGDTRYSLTDSLSILQPNISSACTTNHAPFLSVGIYFPGEVVTTADSVRHVQADVGVYAHGTADARVQNWLDLASQASGSMQLRMWQLRSAWCAHSTCTQVADDDTGAGQVSSATTRTARRLRPAEDELVLAQAKASSLVAWLGVSDNTPSIAWELFLYLAQAVATHGWQVAVGAPAQASQQDLSTWAADVASFASSTLQQAPLVMKNAEIVPAVADSQSGGSSSSGLGQPASTFIVAGVVFGFILAIGACVFMLRRRHSMKWSHSSASQSSESPRKLASQDMPGTFSARGGMAAYDAGYDSYGLESLEAGRHGTPEVQRRHSLLSATAVTIHSMRGSSSHTVDAASTGKLAVAKLERANPGLVQSLRDGREQTRQSSAGSDRGAGWTHYLYTSGMHRSTSIPEDSSLCASSRSAGISTVGMEQSGLIDDAEPTPRVGMGALSPEQRAPPSDILQETTSEPDKSVSLGARAKQMNRSQSSDAPRKMSHQSSGSSAASDGSQAHAEPRIAAAHSASAGHSINPSGMLSGSAVSFVHRAEQSTSQGHELHSAASTAEKQSASQHSDLTASVGSSSDDDFALLLSDDDEAAPKPAQLPELQLDLAVVQAMPEDDTPRGHTMWDSATVAGNALARQQAQIMSAAMIRTNRKPMPIHPMGASGLGLESRTLRAGSTTSSIATRSWAHSEISSVASHLSRRSDVFILSSASHEEGTLVPPFQVTQVSAEDDA